MSAVAAKMPTQARAHRTRESLLDAAVELFATKGSLETTFDAISEASGISRGSIRFHFGSKDGLLFAVVDRVFAQWEQEVLGPMLGEATGPTSFRGAFEAHRDFVRQNEAVGRLFFVLLFEALGPRPDLKPRFAELHERFRSNVRTWVQAEQSNGSIRKDVDLDALTVAILGALGGVHYQWRLDPDNVDLDRVHESLIEIMDRALRP